MSVEPVRLSVALVTRNRPERLSVALASLQAQETQPFEVLVSDDSDPEFQGRTEAAARASGCRYQLGPRRGLYANRNASITACSGTHIRTMDDDHELPPGHLAACLEAVRGEPGAVWSCAEVQWWNDGALGMPGELHPRGFLVEPLDGMWPAAIADGAAIYPREIFDAGLRFDEAFAFGYVYQEFASLLWSLGCRMRTVPGTAIVHQADAADLQRVPTRETETVRLYAAAMLVRRRPSLSGAFWVATQAVRSLAVDDTVPLRAVRAVRRRRGALQALTAAALPHSVFSRHDDARAPVAGLRGLHPSLRPSAVGLHRLAHHVFLRGRPGTARRLAQLNARWRGLRIDPSATVGPGLMLPDGPTGIVVEQGAVLGAHVRLRRGAHVRGGATVPDRAQVWAPSREHTTIV